MSRGNEPAYPATQYYEGQPNYTNEGMTLREHFAATAMQGLCAHFGTCGEQDIAETTRRAVMVADALIAELAKVKS